MLKSINESMASPAVKFLLFLMAVAMVGFYGFSGSCSGVSQSTSATVNGTNIDQRELSRALRSTMAYQQSLGIDFSKFPPSMMTMLEKQALEGLIQQKLILQQAQSIGMVIPKKAIKNNIQEQFTQSEQAFDFNQYKNYLASLGQTPAQFEKEEGEKIVVRSLYQAMNEASVSPAHLIKANYAIDQTQANVSYLKVNQDNIQTKLNVISPTEQNLKEYYEKNKDSYRIPEKRSFTLSWLDLGSFLPQASDNDLMQTLKTVYTAEQRKKLSLERFNARHILIKGQNAKTKAAKILQRLKSGEDFSKLALLESEDPGSRVKGGQLGYFSDGAMVAEFQNAVQSLKVNQLSPPVKSSFGYHIIEVLDKIPAGKVNVKRLENELRYVWKSRALQQEKFKNAALAEAKKVFPSSAQTKKYSDVGQNDSLKSLPSNNDTSIVMGKAMSTELNQSSDIFTAASDNYLYQVTVDNVRKSTIPQYQTIAQAVKSDYLKKEYQKSFAEFIAQKNQQLLKGEIKDIQSLAQSLDLKTQTSEWFTANDTSKLKTDLNVTDIKPALSMQKGSVFSKTIVRGKDHYFVAVENIKQPDWDAFDPNKKKNSDLSNQKTMNWINDLKKNADIELAPQYEESEETQKS